MSWLLDIFWVMDGWKLDVFGGWPLEWFPCWLFTAGLRHIPVAAAAAVVVATWSSFVTLCVAMALAPAWMVSRCRTHAENCGRREFNVWTARATPTCYGGSCCNCPWYFGTTIATELLWYFFANVTLRFYIEISYDLRVAEDMLDGSVSGISILHALQCWHWSYVGSVRGLELSELIVISIRWMTKVGAEDF